MDAGQYIRIMKAKETESSEFGKMLMAFESTTSAMQMKAGGSSMERKNYNGNCAEARKDSLTQDEEIARTLEEEILRQNKQDEQQPEQEHRTFTCDEIFQMYYDIYSRLDELIQAEEEKQKSNDKIIRLLEQLVDNTDSMNTKLRRL